MEDICKSLIELSSPLCDLIILSWKTFHFKWSQKKNSKRMMRSDASPSTCDLFQEELDVIRLIRLSWKLKSYIMRLKNYFLQIDTIYTSQFVFIPLPLQHTIFWFQNQMSSIPLQENLETAPSQKVTLTLSINLFLKLIQDSWRFHAASYLQFPWNFKLWNPTSSIP